MAIASALPPLGWLAGGMLDYCTAASSSSYIAGPASASHAFSSSHTPASTMTEPVRLSRALISCDTRIGWLVWLLLGRHAHHTRARTPLSEHNNTHRLNGRRGSFCCCCAWYHKSLWAAGLALLLPPHSCGRRSSVALDRHRSKACQAPVPFDASPRCHPECSFDPSNRKTFPCCRVVNAV